MLVYTFSASKTTVSNWFAQFGICVPCCSKLHKASYELSPTEHFFIFPNPIRLSVFSIIWALYMNLCPQSCIKLLSVMTAKSFNLKKSFLIFVGLKVSMLQWIYCVLIVSLGLLYKLNKKSSDGIAILNIPPGSRIRRISCKAEIKSSNEMCSNTCSANTYLNEAS